MISKRYEIKKQVIGEDPDLEKSGRKLNRVIAWNRDGITIEADQRHVREILKGFELERASHSATPCAMERKDEGKGGHRRRQGQTRTKHEPYDMDNGDNRGRLQVADDDDNDSPALAGGSITSTRCTNQLFVARSTRSQVCIDAGVLCNGEADHARHGTRQEDRTILRWEAESDV